jgi:large subunit ribosomal protein L25
MPELLTVQHRSTRGKRNARRLRKAGSLPAVLYGHGEKSVSLALPTEQFEAALRHRAKVVQLSGDAEGRALIQELQWDTFSTRVLHVDLMRVAADERVTLVVPIELRGSAPGEREGGVVEHLLHEIEVETTVDTIPERLHVNVNSLELHGSLSTSDIEDLPPGAKILVDEPQVIVQCVEPPEEPEEEELAVGEAEPEIIGRKDKDEAESEEA